LIGTYFSNITNHLSTLEETARSSLATQQEWDEGFKTHLELVSSAQMEVIDLFHLLKQEAGVVYESVSKASQMHASFIR
jgi:hypothetical protein